MLLFLLAQAASASGDVGISAQHCQLTNPNGENLSFSVTRNQNGHFEISAREGSAWPRRQLTVSSVEQTSRSDRSLSAYAIGTGPLAKRLVVNGSGQAVIYTLSADELALPVAAGFCNDIATGDATVVPASTVDPFAPARWPDDCGFIAQDGRRGRINYDYIGFDAVEIVDVDRAIWSNARYRLRLIGAAGERPRFRGSSRGAQPAGSETFYTFGSTGAKIVEFSSLGSDSLIGEQPALAICGYNNMTTREVAQ